MWILNSTPPTCSRWVPLVLQRNLINVHCLSLRNKCKSDIKCRVMSMQIDSYPILPVNQELHLVDSVNKTCPQREGEAWQRERRINYRSNKLLCCCARSLQSKDTAEGSFCQISWRGCNKGTDSKEEGISERPIVPWKMIATVHSTLLLNPDPHHLILFQNK